MGKNCAWYQVENKQKEMNPSREKNTGSLRWGFNTVMQLSAKRGHVCAADLLVSEDTNIL